MSADLEQKKKDLKVELDKFQFEFKVELPKKIAEAREYGDLKENAEYHAARERQSFVKAKIGQISEQLAQLNEMNLDDLPKDKVAFGSIVKIIDVDTDDTMEFTFVSSNEVNPAQGKISMSTPYGEAMRNKGAGDTIEVVVPAGKRTFFIEKLTTVHGETFEVPFED